jgi:hypothetical protein
LVCWSLQVVSQLASQLTAVPALRLVLDADADALWRVM